MVQHESQYEPKFLLLDHLGSTRAELVFDPSTLAPQIEEYYDLMPYGEVIDPPTTQESVLFTGKSRDSESGLDNFGARFFGNSSCRFACVDSTIITPERFSDPQQLNLYSYVRDNPLKFIDPTGETLVLSGNKEDAKAQLIEILGSEFENRIYFNEETNTFSVDLGGVDLSRNEGAALLNDIVNSTNIYDLSIGSTVETLGGIIEVEHIKNLDNNIDDRYNYRNPPGKVDTELPRLGIDSQIAIDLTVTRSRISTTTLQSATTDSVLFHELAEAYEKVDHNKQYRQAHQSAISREERLRNQRPYLRQHNPGSGPGERIIIRR